METLNAQKKTKTTENKHCPFDFVSRFRPHSAPALRKNDDTAFVARSHHSLHLAALRLRSRRYKMAERRLAHNRGRVFC